MINPIFEQNFVNKMNRQMGLNINVMNEQGVIIASVSPERIGTFHICAYEILEQGLDLSVTETAAQDLIGVIGPGVNMRLVSNRETIGVIGVTGEPEQVLNLAKMVKLTFETMYEYEYRRKQQISARDELGAFAYTLLLETPHSPAAIVKAARKLRLKDGLPRLPIYLSFLGDQTALSFLEWYSASALSHSQDVLLPADGGILLCKALDRRKGSEDPDLDELETCCIEEIRSGFFHQASARPGNAPVRFFIGPVQTEFQHYHRLYAWFRFVIQKTAGSPELVLRLTDYLPAFLAQECRELTQPLLSYYGELVREHIGEEMFRETVRCLWDADLKAEEAAARLHLHKNSVFARLRKIKSVLHLNPLSSPRDAAMLAAVCQMLEEEG